MSIEPLEIESRVRVKGRHANIVAVKSTDPLVYLVEFDDDVVYKPTKNNPNAHAKVKRELAHAEITAVMQWCEPLSYRVAVEPALFLKMEKATGFEDIPAYDYHASTAKAKKQVAIEGTPVQTPVLWRDHYWLARGGGRLHDGKGWYATEMQLFPLIAVAAYTGEIKTPRRYFDGYDGFVVTCELGKFVVDDKPVTVFPSEPIYYAKEDGDEDEPMKTQPRVRKARKRSAQAEPIAQTEPEQMAFICDVTGDTI